MKIQFNPQFKQIGNKTWAHGDMDYELIFECSHRYRTSEISNVNTRR